jgi:hypothetical protein
MLCNDKEAEHLELDNALRHVLHVPPGGAQSCTRFAV